MTYTWLHFNYLNLEKLGSRPITTIIYKQCIIPEQQNSQPFKRQEINAYCYISRNILWHSYYLRSMLRCVGNVWSIVTNTDRNKSQPSLGEKHADWLIAIVGPNSLDFNSLANYCREQRADILRPSYVVITADLFIW